MNILWGYMYKIHKQWVAHIEIRSDGNKTSVIPPFIIWVQWNEYYQVLLLKNFNLIIFECIKSGLTNNGHCQWYVGGAYPTQEFFMVSKACFFLLSLYFSISFTWHKIWKLVELKGWKLKEDSDFVLVSSLKAEAVFF